MQTSRQALALTLAIPLSIGVLLGAPAGADDEAAGLPLEVMVHGTGGGGVVNWALYASAEQYDADKQMRGGRQVAAGESTAVSLGNVPPGRYSVAIFLDEDEDGEFDQNFLGIPKEPFGFSNDVMGAMGKPSFEKAAFEVDGEGARIEMTLTSF